MLITVDLRDDRWYPVFASFVQRLYSLLQHIQTHLSCGPLETFQKSVITGKDGKLTSEGTRAKLGIDKVCAGWVEGSWLTCKD